MILIVSDWLMPGMKGDEFLSRRRYNIIKILLTGQADAGLEQQANIHCCLYKPRSEEELIDPIKSALLKL